jgi:cytochrome c oxidase assembly protein subunit 15
MYAMMIDAKPRPAHLDHRRPIAIWLLICAALVFAMVVLGGVTRLTGSGLSIVEWDPIMGVIPPVSEAQWEEAFQKYQESPESQKINAGMGLAGFKSIFWLEYLHRLLGRTIGGVFLVPFLYFLIRGWIAPRLVPKLIGVFILGGLQGLLGWYMVKSGLIDNPHVSQYRLTAHLAAGFIIYGYILWVALGLLFPQPARVTAPGLPRLRRFAVAVTGLVFLTALAGGFVAGLKAGLAYNTFPLMNGQWIPDGYLRLEPLYSNLFENVAAVQFNHRWLAVAVLAAVVLLWFVAQRFDLPGRARTVFHLLLLMAAVQVTLGISTLLLHVPLALAVAHQAGALMLFTLALFVNHELRQRRLHGP